VPVKYIAFIVFLAIAGSYLTAAADLVFPDSAHSNILLALSSGPFIRMPIGGDQYSFLPSPNPDFFKALWQSATFNYGFLAGDMQMIREILFSPITALVMFGLVLLFIGLLQRSI
jgi:hypothetical protein